MPTVLLLDKSLSMKRPLTSSKHLETRLVLAKKGLVSFLSYLEQTFPLEQISLMSFSSKCEVIVPFTRNHLELKDSLETVTIGDKTNLCNALKVVVDTVVTEWGVFNPVQIVLVTDGTLGTDGEGTPVSIPFPCKLHILMMATKEEFNQPHERVDSLCQMTNTSSSAFVFPSGNVLNTISVCEMFLQLCQTHYQPVTSTLKCGHLQSRISLSPSLLMAQSLHDISTSPQHVFRNVYTILEFPSQLNICGFMDISCLSAPSVYSKHFVIDADPDILKTNRLVKALMDNQPFNEEKMPEADKPSFRVLLHGSLKCESKVALVQLGSNWFGFLSSAAASFKKSNLILTVLFPDAQIPWLGSLHYLGPKPPAKDPRMSDNASRNNKDIFPVSLSHIFSYQLPPGNLHWAKESVVQADMTKVLRYSHKLPDKESSFVKELNKLRSVVFTYSLPTVIDKLCQILSSEETSVSNPQAKAIIQRSIQFLSSNHNPHEKLSPLGTK